MCNFINSGKKDRWILLRWFSSNKVILVLLHEQEAMFLALLMSVAKEGGPQLLSLCSMNSWQLAWKSLLERSWMGFFCCFLQSGGTAEMNGLALSFLNEAHFYYLAFSSAATAAMLNVGILQNKRCSMDDSSKGSDLTRTAPFLA